MRRLFFLLFLFLFGCASPPPKPPSAQGEYKPINRPQPQSKSPEVFDFYFDGDIVDALRELKKVQPQLSVLPPNGVVSPVHIQITLSATTLENALKEIGIQGNEIADVVWTTTSKQGVSKVFIQFKKLTKERGSYERSKQK